MGEGLRNMLVWKRIFALFLAALAIFLWANAFSTHNDSEVLRVHKDKVEENLDFKEEPIGYEDIGLIIENHGGNISRESPFLSAGAKEDGEFTYILTSKEEEVVNESLSIEVNLLGIVTKGKRGLALVEKEGEIYFLEDGDGLDSFEVRIWGQDKLILIKDDYEYEILIKKNHLL